MIRAFRPSDAPLVALFTREKSLVVEPTCAALVCEIDGVAAGISELTDAGHIRYLAVAPSYSRRGVGDALLSAHRDAHPGQLTVDAGLSTRGFFERHGFVASQVDGPPFRMVLVRSSD